MFPNDVGISMNFHVPSGLSLTNVQVASSYLTAKHELSKEVETFSVDSVDTTDNFVTHTKTAKTFNKSGRWQVMAHLESSSGVTSWHGMGEVLIEKPLGEE